MGSRVFHGKNILVQAIAAALLTTTGVPGLAQAQQASTTETGAPSYRVDIPAQPLASALETFARQTGLQVVYAGAAGSRAQSGALSGNYTARQALQHLLAPAGLDYEFVNANTVAVRERSADKGAAAVTAPTPQATVDAENTLGAITVTGTHLKNIDPATPLMVIDAQMIESRGFTSVEDVLRNLPQNFSNRTSTSRALGEVEYGSTYGDGVSGIGSSGANLRGLGSRSTLILVDGRRRSGSAQGQGAYTDMSSIPVSQIERIEVLSDGASAIYGADAVAGVINIVMKKSYSGTVIGLRHENSSTGADVSRLDLARTFGHKTGRITVAIGADRTSPANTNDLIHIGPKGRGDFTDLGGANTRTRNKGEPGIVYESVDYGIGYHFIGDVIGVIPGGQNGTALDPASLRPYDPNTAPSVYQAGRIGPKVDNKYIRVNGTQDLGAGTRLDFGASYVRQVNRESWQPSLFDFNILEDGFDVYVPQSNRYNTFGRDVMVGYSFERELEGMRLSEDQNQTNIDAYASVHGKLPFAKKWEYEVGLSTSREKGTTTALGDLTGSLGAEGYARTQAVLDGLNVFGDGSDGAVIAQNRKLLESLVERFVYRYQSRAYVLDGLFRGELFSLPAGKVEAAFGGQYRQQRYAYESNLVERVLSKGRGRSDAAFAEVGIPLLKDLPFARKLNLTLAARYERFHQGGENALRDDSGGLGTLGGFDIGALTGTRNDATAGLTGSGSPVSRGYSRTSPLARLAWVPFGELRLRGTWGKSFLVPQMQQQFGQLTLRDATGSLAFNGVALPPGITGVVALTGPNVNLRPQIATTMTYGFDWNPTFVTGLQLSATYNRTSFENYIGDPLTGLTYAQIFNNIASMPPGSFTTGQNGVLLWDNRAINFLGRRSRSVDANASYYLNSPVGDWHIELNATRTLELTSRSLASMPTFTYSDSELGPSKWVGDLFVGWERGSWLASLSSHYSSGHRVLNPLSAQCTVYNDCTPNPNPRTHSGPYATLDAQIGYRREKKGGLLGGTTVRLGAQNIFDRKFPFVDNQYGFLSSRVNVRGRVLYLDIKKEF